MPNIGIDYTPAYEQGAGIGRYVRELITALLAYDPHSTYQLFVAGANTDKLPQVHSSRVTWHTTRMNPIWLARLWHRARIPVPIELFTGKLDLFHATDFVLPPTRPHTRTILQVHDLSFVRVPETASPSLKAYLDRVVPASAQRADHILADSAATRDDLCELYGLPARKITVLYGGVDAHFQPQSEQVQIAVRKKYHLDNSPFIFSVGTVQPRKNYERLIKALALIHRQHADIHLVIAGGKGWLDAPIYALVKELNLSDFVHFIGFADDTDLPGLYSAAVCMAYPSLYEGFGLPVLEAMACHTPVLTSTVSSMPEAAGDAAILIDPLDTEAIAEQLALLITDSVLRQQLVAKGIEHIKQFTWQNAAQKLHAAYLALL